MYQVGQRRGLRTQRWNEYFSRRCATHPERVFLDDGERRYSYADLDRETARYAALLTGLGLVAGKPYEAYVWARAEGPASLRAALQSGDGAQRHTFA